jgi:hypothetical protein
MTDMDQRTLERLAGREATLAVFRSPTATPDAPPIAIVIDLGEDAQLVKTDFDEQFVPRLRASDPDLRVMRERAPGGEIVHFQNGPDVGYIRFVGDLLVAGPKDILARFAPDGSVPAWMADNPVPGGIACAYMNVAPLWEIARAAGADEGLMQSGLPAIAEVFARTDVIGGGFKDTIVARLDPQTEGFLPALMGLEAGPAQAAGVLPADYDLLASLQIGSGEKLYDVIEAVTLQQGGPQALNQLRAGRDQIDAAFTINIEWELLPAIGHEVFFAAHTPDLDTILTGQQPSWADFEPLFGFAVRDADQLQDLISRFAASPLAMQKGWVLSTDAHEGVEVHTLSNLAPGFRLSLACVGGYCVCATDEGLVRRAIEAVKGGPTLAADPRYADTVEHLGGDQQVGLYVDTKPLQDMLLAAMQQNARDEARAFLPIVTRSLPDVGPYALALGGGQDEMRVEAYGDLPALFAAFSFLAVGGTTAVQVEAGGQAGPPADELGAFLEQ